MAPGLTRKTAVFAHRVFAQPLVPQLGGFPQILLLQALQLNRVEAQLARLRGYVGHLLNAGQCLLPTLGQVLLKSIGSIATICGLLWAHICLRSAMGILFGPTLKRHGLLEMSIPASAFVTLTTVRFRGHTPCTWLPSLGFTSP